MPKEQGEGRKKKNRSFFRKPLDKRAVVWYDIRVKQSRALRSHPGTGCDRGLIGAFPAVRGRSPCGDSGLCTAYFFAWRCCTISAKEKETLLNEEITAKEVRLIGPAGETLGIMSASRALEQAYDRGMDLVMMSAQAVPPVCKIMDYGKFCFERDKREKEARKKQTTVELKEIQLSCRIDTHDFETKVRHAQRFLGDGNKVRVVMKFKGREMSHTEIGREVLGRFQAACADCGTVDKAPVQDGRFLSMIISPVKAK